MRSIILLILISLISFSLLAQAPAFGPQQDKGLIEFAQITEASGIASSKKNINILWVHNDSQDSSRLFAINNSGKHLGVFKIENAVNRDWEDIAIGPGPDESKDYIYIAEIGDNNTQYNNIFIFRIPEPVVDAGQNPVYFILENADIIKLKFPGGPRDAETLLIDPLTKDIYIVSKRENNVGVYLAAYPQSLTDTLTLEHVATLPLTQIVGGDISIDGKEILLKNYDNVYYWYRNPEQTFAEAFNNNQFFLLPYVREPQGEAVCWSYNSDGYYTISEEPFNIPAHLYFYPRLSPNEIESEKNKDEGSEYHLEQNYPNPFNPRTNIRFRIPDIPDSKTDLGSVSLKVYNAIGEEIVELFNEAKRPGKYELSFNASKFASGIYFYKLQTDKYVETKTMTLIK